MASTFKACLNTHLKVMGARRNCAGWGGGGQAHNGHPYGPNKSPN